MKKIAALLIALVLAISLPVSVFASAGGGYVTPPSGGSSSSNDDDDDDSGYGGGRADSGSSASNTPSAANPAPATQAQVTAATSRAIEQATAAGESTATLTNVSTVAASVIQNAFARAASAGITDMTVNIDSRQGNVVLSRIYLDAATAAQLSGTVNFSVKTQGAEVNRAVATFERFFSNQVAAVSLGQQGAYGANIPMAVKADLSGLNTASLVFYAYDRAANSYTRIAAPAYRLDANGYLHFSTPVGGDIIISDSPLAK